MVADGAFGTYLYKKGIPLNKNFSLLNIENPELVKSIHREYIIAGAELIETNTFSANLYKIPDEDICYKANLEGAKIAKEVSENKVLVAGSIGPIGKPIYPFSEIKKEDIKKYFYPQVKGLIDGNVDLLIVETQVLIEEAEEILKVIKEIKRDIPIILSFSFNEDKLTPFGVSIKDVVELAEKYKVEFVGANCGVGPIPTLEIINEFLNLTKIKVSSMPNAGYPVYKKGGFFYPSHPEHFLEYAIKMVEEGVKIIGGCCGTEPRHISLIKQNLGEISKKGKGKKILIEEKERKGLRVICEGNLFKEKINKNEFIISIEVYPPKGILTEKIFEKFKILKQKGIKFVNVVDLPLARMRMSGIAFAHIVKEKFGFEPILHFTCRDRNLLSIYADLLGARALGIKNILALTGDPLFMGDYPHATANYDLTKTGLLKLIKFLNEGKDISGRDIDVKFDFFAGTSISFYEIYDEDKIKEKVDSGAQFFYTQPVYNKFYIEKFKEKNDFPIFAGILLCKDLKQFEYFSKEVPDIEIPEDILKKFEDFKDDFLNIQEEILVNLIFDLKKISNGIYIISPGVKTEFIEKIIKEI
ncbi:MAG: bifunctional homocysteine S-methyltransferase/methylenetetrahydrofolate reductase [candidate division WOR-3 bacterium]